MACSSKSHYPGKVLYYDGNMTVKEIMSKDLPSPLKGSGTSNTRFLHQNTNQTSTIARQRQHYTHTTRLAHLKRPSQAISHQSTHNNYPLHHHTTGNNRVLSNSLSSHNSTPQRQPHHDAYHLQIKPQSRSLLVGILHDLPRVSVQCTVFYVLRTISKKVLNNIQMQKTNADEIHTATTCKTILFPNGLWQMQID